MTAYRIDMSRLPSIDANSVVRSGAKLYIYANTTTTPLSLYSDYLGTVPAANPIVADSSGNFPVRYVGSSARFTWALTTSADVAIYSDDDIEPVPNIANADLANYLPLAGGTMTGAVWLKEAAAIASATTVNLDAAGGNIGHITGTTTIAGMTLSTGLFWAIFDAACPLTHSSTFLLLGSASFTTSANDIAVFFGDGAGVTRMVAYICSDGKPLIEPTEILIAVGDETTAITNGVAKRTFRMPFAMTLDALPRASLTTASSSGNPAIDINESGVSIFSTTLTIDANETTSTTAATPAVLSDTALADDAAISIDIDTAGTNAAGLKVLLRGYRRNRS